MTKKDCTLIHCTHNWLVWWWWWYYIDLVSSKHENNRNRQKSSSQQSFLFHVYIWLCFVLCFTSFIPFFIFFFLLNSHRRVVHLVYIYIYIVSNNPTEHEPYITSACQIIRVPPKKREDKKRERKLQSSFCFVNPLLYCIAANMFESHFILKRAKEIFVQKNNNKSFSITHSFAFGCAMDGWMFFSLLLEACAELPLSKKHTRGREMWIYKNHAFSLQHC